MLFIYGKMFVIKCISEIVIFVTWAFMIPILVPNCFDRLLMLLFSQMLCMHDVVVWYLTWCYCFTINVSWFKSWSHCCLCIIKVTITVGYKFLLCIVSEVEPVEAVMCRKSNLPLFLRSLIIIKLYNSPPGLSILILFACIWTSRNVWLDNLLRW